MEQIVVSLDKKHRLMENEYGVFLQRKQPSAKHWKGKSWKTLKMYPDLDDAFKDWNTK